MSPSQSPKNRALADPDIDLKYLLTAWPEMAILWIYIRRWLDAYENSKMGE